MRCARLPTAALLGLLATNALAQLPQWRHRGVPLPIADHSLSFDIARGELLLFGSYRNVTLAETWLHRGDRWQQVTGTQPPPRFLAAAAYDAVRQRTVLFGGSTNSGPIADLWMFDGGASRWTPIATTAAPPARSGHAIVHDVQVDRVFLFGGHDLGQFKLGDTWSLDAATGNWTQLQPTTSPPARTLHSMTFDLATGRTLLFGGFGALGFDLGDTWTFDGVAGTWAQALPATAPSARSAAQLTYDTTRMRALLCGGFDSGNLGDTWEWNGAAGTWTQLPIATPTPIGTMAFDVAHARTVQFGGALRDNAMWMLPSGGTTWTIAEPAYQVAATAGPAIVSDLASGRLLTRTLQFDGATERWSSLPTLTPPPRTGHTLALDVDRGAMVLFGGATQFALLGDTWELDVASSQWTQRAPTAAPFARRDAAMAYDPRLRRCVLFGGQDLAGNVRLGDTWSFDGTAGQWSQLAVTTPPSARAGHALIQHVHLGRTLLFGGFDGALRNDTWLFDGTARTWTQITTAAAPPARSGFALAYDPRRGEAILFGGAAGVVAQNDCWSFDAATHDWLQRAASAAPPARSSHALGYNPVLGTMQVLGGRDGTGQLLQDHWALEPARTSTFARHGVGCAGSVGEPRIDAAPAGLGGTLALQIQALPATGACFLLFGFELDRWNGARLPLDLAPLGLPGCRAWLAPIPGTGRLVPIVAGTAATSIAIPPFAGLAGTAFATQAVVLDPAASSGIGAVTAAGVATIF